MSKTTKKFPGFLKIYKRPSTTTRFVHDLDTRLLDVDKDSRWCNEWRFMSKDAN